MQLKRYIYIGLGSLFVAVGVVGIFLPILPTTPFLLLAAWLFARSSERLHFWLLHHKYFGSYVSDFTVHKAISLKAKIVSMLFMWSAILYSALVVLQGNLLLQLLLLGIAIFVSYYILSFKTKLKKR